jgi:hypothetical protein
VTPAATRLNPQSSTAHDWGSGTGAATTAIDANCILPPCARKLERRHAARRKSEDSKQIEVSPQARQRRAPQLVDRGLSHQLLGQLQCAIGLPFDTVEILRAKYTVIRRGAGHRDA